MIASVSDICRDTSRRIPIEHCHLFAVMCHNQGTRQVTPFVHVGRPDKEGLTRIQDNCSCFSRENELIFGQYARGNVDQGTILDCNNQEGARKNIVIEHTIVLDFLVKALDDVIRSQTLHRQHKRSVKRIGGDVADENRHRICGSQHQ